MKENILGDTVRNNKTINIIIKIMRTWHVHCRVSSNIFYYCRFFGKVNNKTRLRAFFPKATIFQLLLIMKNSHFSIFRKKAIYRTQNVCVELKSSVSISDVVHATLYLHRTSSV